MCALYGSSRDLSFFHKINRELIHNIIEQQIGYYQIDLDNTPTNVYNDPINGVKNYRDPVLVMCLIDRGDYESDYKDLGPDIARSFTFRFLRKDLMEYNVVPQIGDIILWNNDYYEINLVNENQPIAGKVPEYNYGDEHRDNFGESWSIICNAHYVSPEKLGISQVR